LANPLRSFRTFGSQIGLLYRDFHSPPQDIHLPLLHPSLWGTSPPFPTSQRQSAQSASQGHILLIFFSPKASFPPFVPRGLVCVPLVPSLRLSSLQPVVFFFNFARPFCHFYYLSPPPLFWDFCTPPQASLYQPLCAPPCPRRHPPFCATLSGLSQRQIPKTASLVHSFFFFCAKPPLPATVSFPPLGGLAFFSINFFFCFRLVRAVSFEFFSGVCHWRFVAFSSLSPPIPPFSVAEFILLAVSSWALERIFCFSLPAAFVSSFLRVCCCPDGKCFFFFFPIFLQLGAPTLLWLCPDPQKGQFASKAPFLGLLLDRIAFFSGPLFSFFLPSPLTDFFAVCPPGSVPGRFLSPPPLFPSYFPPLCCLSFPSLKRGP